MISNLFWFLIVIICYFSLFMLIPFWLRGFKLSGENVMDNLVTSFLYSNVVIILSAIFLSLIGIYYWFTITLLLIIIAFSYRLIFIKQHKLDKLSVKALNLKQYLLDFADGYYHPRILLKKILEKPKAFFINTMHKINNPIGSLFTIAIFGYGIYIRSYHSVVNMFYGTSDMYFHTEWIKYFMNNKPYISGVYPFGYHSVIAVVSSIFHINVVTVMQMIGPIFGILIIFSLYYILRRSLYSTFAINVALLLYIVTDIFPFWASERHYLALPQEFGTIFLYLTAYFLYRYLIEKKLKDLISFSLCVSLTLLTHFFVTVYAVFICAIVFFVRITQINIKVLKQLIVGVLCALVIAIMPLGAGLIKGIEFNGSMDWALSFFFGSRTEENAEEVTGDEITNDEIMNDEITKKGITDIYDTLKNEGYFDKSYNLSLLNVNWFIPYLIAAFIALFAPIFNFKDKGRQWMHVVFSGYSLLICFFYILSSAEIYSIMENSRLYAFYIYSVPLVICSPFEILYLFLCGTKKAMRSLYLILITVVTGIGGMYIVTYQRFMPLGRVWQSQYNGAVLTYYNIVNQFPKNNWIIVSSMSEYTLCLFKGYHYQMAKFIMDMNDYNENTEIYLPAENIFIYVVKRPNTYLYTDLQYLGKFEALPVFDESDALVDFEKTYNITINSNLNTLYDNYNANHVLQAKAYTWAMEYKKYFSNEMTIYYEDDEIIVYRVKQNLDALNNFAISYIGNQK